MRNIPPTHTPAPTKVCKVCGVEKPRTDFYGRELRCKACYVPILAQRSAERARRAEQRPARVETVRQPKQHRVAQGTYSARTRAMHDSVSTLAHEPPATILRSTADMVREAEWAEGDRPDVFGCLVACTGVGLEDRLDHIGGDGWSHKRHQGVYLPESEVEKYLGIVRVDKAARTALVRITGLLAEAAGWDDLGVWSREYSTGPQDVVDVFERAALLAERRFPASGTGQGAK